MATANPSRVIPPAELSGIKTDNQRIVSTGPIVLAKLLPGIGYQANISVKDISKIEVFDIDMVLFLKDGRRIIIAGGALEAQNQNPQPLITTEGTVSLKALLEKVGEIHTEKIVAPVLASAVVVNAAQQDKLKQPFGNAPGSARTQQNQTNGTEDANPGAGSVQAEPIDTIVQALQRGQQATKSLRDEEQRESNKEVQVQISSSPSTASLAPVTAGIKNVQEKQYDKLTLSVSSYNVGGADVSGSTVNGGMGTPLSKTDPEPVEQAKPLTIDTTALPGITTINAMGRFADTVGGFMFERTIKLQYLGAKELSSLRVKDLPAGMKFRDGEATYDSTTGIWTINLAKQAASTNNGQVTEVTLTLRYNPKDISSAVSGSYLQKITLLANGIFFGETFTDNSQTINLVGREVHSKDDFTITNSNTAYVILPTTTTGSVIRAGDGDQTIAGTYNDDNIDGGGGADTMTGNGGNDTFVIDNVGDRAVGGNTGTNKVLVKSAGNLNAGSVFSIQSQTENTSMTQLLENIQNAELDSSASATTLQGNNQPNELKLSSRGGRLVAIANTDPTTGDTLIGSTRNDTFVIASSNDVIQPNGGQDAVETVSSFDLSKAAYSDIKNLTFLTAVTSTPAGQIGVGNSSANILTGRTTASANGAVKLDGGVNSAGSGVDTFVGGANNDTFILRNLGDVINTHASVPSTATNIYTVEINYTGLTAVRIADFNNSRIRNVTLGTGTQSASINVYGTSASNYIVGNGGNNYLDGGAGTTESAAQNDTLVGGGGSDTFVVYTSNTMVDGNGGNTAINGNLVESRAPSFTLTTTTVRNIRLWNDDDSLARDGKLSTAGGLLLGNRFDNVLDDGLGAATLIGNSGSDTYIVTNTGTVVSESINYSVVNDSVDIPSLNNPDAGAGDNLAAGSRGDMVKSKIGSYTLPSYVESLLLIGGNTAQVGIGNGLANWISAQPGTNDGTASNTSPGTFLYGGKNGTGVNGDTLVGGLNGSNFISANANDVIQTNGGINKVYYLYSPRILTLNVGEVYLVDGSESLVGQTLTGTNTAGAGDFVAGVSTPTKISVIGSTAANNVHRIRGGSGDDTFVIRNVNDVIQAASPTSTGNGKNTIELVLSGAGTYVMPQNVEDLVFQGSGNATITANNETNTITTGDGNDYINAASAPNTLSGRDTLIGGRGDDTYVVSSAGADITENSGGGDDWVLVRGTNAFTLPANIENIGSAPTGDATPQGVNLIGNEGQNRLYGSKRGADRLQGSPSLAATQGDYFDGWGNDSYTIPTNAQNIPDDTYIGNAGNDTFVVHSANTQITTNGGRDEIIVASGIDYSTGLSNVAVISASANDRAPTTGSRRKDYNINLTYTGGADIKLVGNSESNVLTGGSGNDLLIGSNITFSIERNQDGTISSFQRNSGTYANISDGGGQQNNEYGARYADLPGGADTLRGGAGNDAYVVTNSQDRISDTGGQSTVYIATSASTSGFNSFDFGATTADGTALRTFVDPGTTVTLYANLIGDGNNFTVTAGHNKTTITDHTDNGNTLNDGGHETVVMNGGRGDDSYYLSNANTTVNDSTDNANAGTDTVYLTTTLTSGAGGTVAYNMPNLIENLVAVDPPSGVSSRALNITGNSIDNQISLSRVNLSLPDTSVNGGAGNDTLTVTPSQGVLNSFNFSTLVNGNASKITGIENLDLTQMLGSSRSVLISSSDIRLLFSSSSGSLNLSLGSGTTLTIDSGSSSLYTHSGGTEGSYTFYTDATKTTQVGTLNVTLA